MDEKDHETWTQDKLRKIADEIGAESLPSRRNVVRQAAILAAIVAGVAALLVLAGVGAHGFCDVRSAIPWLAC